MKRHFSSPSFPPALAWNNDNNSKSNFKWDAAECRWPIDINSIVNRTNEKILFLNACFSFQTAQSLIGIRVRRIESYHRSHLARERQSYHLPSLLPRVPCRAARRVTSSILRTAISKERKKERKKEKSFLLLLPCLVSPLLASLAAPSGCCCCCFIFFHPHPFTAPQKAFHGQQHLPLLLLSASSIGKLFLPKTKRQNGI